MGYEIIFHHKVKDKVTGEYNDKGSFKKRIGDPYEDTPIDHLAGLILKQLARRDIWVEDVEIYEITKKRVSFKETKSGIVIKNKKFIFDDNFELKIQQEDEHPQIEQTTQSSQQKHVEVSNTTLPIGRMIYFPEPPQHSKVIKQGIRLTPNKVYNILKTEEHPNGVSKIFTIIDDNNLEKKISDDYFIPNNPEINDSVDDDGDGLNWQGVINSNIPNVR